MVADFLDEEALSLELTRERRLRLCGGIVDFLAAEGYVRFENRRPAGIAFSHVVLTARGLAALSRTAEPAKPTITLGERLKPALAELGRALTWKGHELLDRLRSATVWNRVLPGPRKGRRAHLRGRQGSGPASC